MYLRNRPHVCLPERPSNNCKPFDHSASFKPLVCLVLDELVDFRPNNDDAIHLADAVETIGEEFVAANGLREPVFSDKRTLEEFVQKLDETGVPYAIVYHWALGEPKIKTRYLSRLEASSRVSSHLNREYTLKLMMGRDT